MRFIFMGIMALVLVLSACATQSSSQNTDNPEQKAEKEKQTKDQQENKDKDKDKQETDDTNEQKEQDENKQDKQAKKTFTLKKPKYKMTENYYIKPIGNANPKVVLLTIDDAPDEHAVEMAKTLKRLDAGAIFFINKIFVEQGNGKEKLKKIRDMGFAIGNHTVSHPNLSNLSPEEQRKEIIPVYELIKQVTGESAKFFRAPHGANTDVSNKLAKKHDALVMNWSYGYDFMPDYQDAEKLENIMLETDLLRNGAILLMHDRDWTNKALDDIVKGLRDKGYKILDPSLLKTPQSPK